METITAPPEKFRKDTKISWYRCKIDKQVMSKLVQTSNWQGFRQCIMHLAIFVATGTLAYLAWRNIHHNNWYWAVPVLLAALFLHGTFGPFYGGVACHELMHKTPFTNRYINNFFLRVFSFISWWDPVWFTPSHIKHHQVTVYTDSDGEVVLPQRLSFKDWKFWLSIFAYNPQSTYYIWKAWIGRAFGKMDNDWYAYVMPATNEKLRRQHRNWARFQVLGHLALLVTFILTKQWILIVIFTIGTQYCSWLGMLVGTPQHYGLSPSVPDFRLSCRNYTCSKFIGFLYWNMQYHCDHHMFPAVPFFNLPKLHKAIEHDLPPATHGLRATWKQIMEIHSKQKTDPNYCYVPPLPKTADDGVENRQSSDAMI